MVTNPPYFLFQSTFITPTLCQGHIHLQIILHNKNHTFSYIIHYGRVSVCVCFRWWDIILIHCVRQLWELSLTWHSLLEVGGCLQGKSAPCRKTSSSGAVMSKTSLQATASWEQKFIGEHIRASQWLDNQVFPAAHHALVAFGGSGYWLGPEPGPSNTFPSVDISSTLKTA